MSHFTVMVVVPPELLQKNGDTINEAVGQLMAPYQENNMGDCPEKFMEFNDVEDESRKEWQEGVLDGLIRVPKARFDLMKSNREAGEYADGKVGPKATPSWQLERCKPDHQDPENQHCWLLTRWNEIFRVFRDGPMGNIGSGSNTHIPPDDLGKVTIRFRILYPTFEEFMKEWKGDDAPDEKTGRYGSWENPNAKWDYWRIGGRWRGTIRIKETAKSQMGPLSYEFKRHFNNGKTHKDDPHTADLAQVKDIDFEGMDMEAHTKITEFWAKIEKIQTIYKKAQEHNEGKLPTMDEMYAACDALGEDRKMWGDMQMGALWRFCDLGFAEWETDEELTKEAGKRIARLRLEVPLLETFAKDHIGEFEFGTFAVCNKDGWFEKGEMGWFGYDGSTPEKRKEWSSNFKDSFLCVLDPETWIAVCDCHI